MPFSMVVPISNHQQLESNCFKKHCGRPAAYAVAAHGSTRFLRPAPVACSCSSFAFQRYLKPIVRQHYVSGSQTECARLTCCLRKTYGSARKAREPWLLSLRVWDFPPTCNESTREKWIRLDTPSTSGSSIVASTSDSTATLLFSSAGFGRACKIG
jgi:hypothetical protein